MLNHAMTNGVAKTHFGDPSVLVRLQRQIAEVRIRSQASRRVSISEVPAGPMVSVLDPATRPAEGMSADRDTDRRDQRIISHLRQFGGARILGAVASVEFADRLAHLYTSHPNCHAAVDYLMGEEILARQTGGAISGIRLLLHGDAGTGKTDFALAVAKCLNLPSEVISLSAAQAGAFLAGSETYWGNSQPGIVWKLLVQGSHSNPLFVLDEVEKAPSTWGDPLGALFQLLEQKSAEIFLDKSVPWLSVNAARCNWIGTANDADRLHPAIRSRFHEVRIESPSEAQLFELIQRLYGNLLKEFGLERDFPAQLAESDVSQLLGRSVRESKHILRMALASALREERTALHLQVSVPIGKRMNIGFLRETS